MPFPQDQFTGLALIDYVTGATPQEFFKESDATQWDDEIIALTSGLRAGQFRAVFNNTAALIEEGKPVKLGVFNVANIAPEVSLAQADAVANLADGVALADIAIGAVGIIVKRHVIAGLNTNAFTVLDDLFLDAAVAGDLVNVAPFNEQRIGRVTVKDAVNGQIEFDVERGAGGNNFAADEVTLENAAAVLRIKDLGVSTAKLALLAVQTGQIDALAVTAAKLGALAVETAKINDLAVTAAKLGALAVTAAKIGALAVETAKINNLAVTRVKLELQQQVYRAFKTADQVKSLDVALADDTHLTIALAAGQYWFRLVFFVSEAGAVAGLEWDVAYSAAVGDSRLAVTETGNTNQTFNNEGLNEAHGNLNSSRTFLLASAGGQWVIVAEGHINVTGAGTLSLQWAQGVSNAGNTTVHKGSFLEVKPLA